MKGRTKAILDTLYYYHGKQYTDFRTCFTFGEENKKTKWRYYLEVQSKDWFIEKTNQREQLKNELIIDLDDKDPGHIERYKYLIKKLDQNGYKFFAFMTKSGRAKHIHIFDERIASLSKYDREQVRANIQEMYGVDLSLKIDAHMVALEFVPHWKTKEMKELIFTNRGDWCDWTERLQKSN